MSKVSVVGTGFVGASSAFAMALNGACSELLLVDLDKERARAEAQDISHAAAVSSGVRVHSGDYTDMTDSDVVVIAAGVNQKPGESRLDLLARNAAIFNSVVPQIVDVVPHAIIIVATNPVDIMTEVTRVLHPNPNLVLGTGTLLDSGRFRDLLGRESGVSARYIHASVLGEHGDTSVLAWDSARVAGLPIPEFLASMGKEWSVEMTARIEQKVRGAAGTIIAGKQATYYGIGAAVMRIASAILKDRQAVMTVSVPTDYGVCLSLPAVIGESGVVRVLPARLSEQEQKKLDYSAQVLLETQSAIIKDGKLLV